ncbi:MAG TPA: fibronectin type III domain-containing protein, partial [Acidimicrobiales bacterium]|nr:fibronectin type III domain-containing protein [Acidimicrobiales bacterium]
FTDSFVGTDPGQAGAGTTTISAPIVGLELDFPAGGQTTALQPASDCGQSQSPVQLALGSPVFTNSVSGTQFVDAFVRASNASDTGAGGVSPDYHVLFSGSNPVNETLSAPSDSGSVGVAQAQGAITCGTQGVVDGAWLRSTIENTVIPELTSAGQVSPASLPVFLMYNTIACEPDPANPGKLDPTTCAAGEHVAYQTASGATQTYAIANYQLDGLVPSLSDSETITHEMTEWVDDPFGRNTTPTWGYVGPFLNSDGSGECLPFLEVADPLSGTATQAVGSNPAYHVPDVAFPQWFFRTAAPTAGGAFSLYGTFTSPSNAASCPQQPISVQASPGDGTAIISWTEPGGGSEVDGYGVCAYPSGTTFDPADPCSPSVDIENDFFTSPTQETFSGLTDGTTYVFRVFAIRCFPSDCSGTSGDLSTASLPSAAVTPEASPATTTTTEPPTTTAPTSPTTTAPTSPTTTAPPGSSSPTTSPAAPVTGARQTIVTASAQQLAFTGAGLPLRVVAATGAVAVLLGVLLLTITGAPGLLRRRLARQRN